MFHHWESGLFFFSSRNTSVGQIWQSAQSFQQYQYKSHFFGPSLTIWIISANVWMKCIRPVQVLVLQSDFHRPKKKRIVGVWGFPGWQLSLWRPLPHPQQISFGCCLEGVKWTGKDKSSFGPHFHLVWEARGSPSENGQPPLQAACMLLTYITWPLLTRRIVPSRRGLVWSRVTSWVSAKLMVAPPLLSVTVGGGIDLCFCSVPLTVRGWKSPWPIPNRGLVGWQCLATSPSRLARTWLATFCGQCAAKCNKPVELW